MSNDISLDNVSDLTSMRCMWMRGGTSKGGYFLSEDLPSDIEARDAALLRIMGSPDARQIDGMGGADPLTSKVAVIKKSERAGVDVDYLFLQVVVDQAIVSDAQNCGNILAGVAPFAIERGLVVPKNGHTTVTIYMENTGQVAKVKVLTREGKVIYSGNTAIDGVPGAGSEIAIEFQDTAGSSCGSLLPTGNVVEVIDGVELTCIDNGMPVVVMRATDMGISGKESRDELESNQALREKLESIRLQVGPMMNLGNVKDKTVPKMTMVSAPTQGGAISTRTFIPHRCHASIGVLGAVSVATACCLEGSPASELTTLPAGNSEYISLNVEHPTGFMGVVLERDADNTISSAAIIRTARKLFDGYVFF